MLLPLFGSVGVGLVWGWLLVQRHRRPSAKRSAPTIHRFGELLALGAATGTVALLVGFLAGRAAIAAFLAATSVALVAHLTWLQTLRTRAPLSNNPRDLS